MLAFFVLMAIAAPPSEVAVNQPAPSARQSTQESLAAARRVVAVIYDEKRQLEAADALVRKHQEPAIRQNAEFHRLEQLHPGFQNALLAEIRAGYRSHARRMLPDFRERIAQLYASQLSAIELDDLGAFYSSRTGGKMLAGMAEQADSSALIRERAGGSVKISADAIGTDQRSTALNMARDFKAEDYDAILALRDKPYFARLMALRAAVAEVHREFASRPPPVVTLRVDSILAKLKRKGAAASR